MIRKQGSGPRPWRARIELRGVKRQESFRTKAEAEEWERKEREDYAREKAGLPVVKGAITYDALCEMYLDNYVSSDDGAWLRRMLTHSRTRFGRVAVRQLRAEQIGRWLHKDLDLSDKSKLHVLTAMRQVLNAGIEWDYLSKSPARTVKPPQGVTKPPPVFPLESWAEVVAVADQAGHYGPLIRFACATGLRPGEWMALTWADLDIPGRTVKVAGTKTAAAARTVSLSRPALAALAELPRPLDQSKRVFTTPGGGKIDRSDFGKNVWHPAVKKAGLRRRPPYQMRHTYATLALAQGVNIEWISKQMGHTNIGITLKFYARFVRQVDERMTALLDQMEEADGGQGLRAEDRTHP